MFFEKGWSMKKHLLVILLTLNSPTAFGEDGYVYGDNHCFYFSAPAAWVADPFSGKRQGLPFVFYPKSSTWASATNVIYARAADKSTIVKSIQDQVNQTLSQFKTEYESPNITAKKIEEIESALGVKGDIYKFSGDKWGNNELVVYFSGAHTINFFVMTSRDEKVLMQDKGNLIELAMSYRESNDCKPCSQKSGGLLTMIRLTLQK